MSTVSRDLPAQPHLSVPKRLARELLAQCKNAELDALSRIRRFHNRLRSETDESIIGNFKLSDAQLIIAHEYGFSSWARLKERITGNTPMQLIDQAIRGNDIPSVTRLLKVYPNLLHVPVISGNWGPPMSHAANMDLLDVVKAISALGAKDHQHAFNRALLHGDIDTAQWLLANGAFLTPGIIMGSCETLNLSGFSFLESVGSPITDGSGNKLAPLAMVLETYSRNPDGKHGIMQRFQANNYQWPHNPVMAFHCGDLDKLKSLLKKEPGMINRRFGYEEIYPTSLGCHSDQVSGLHGTPIGGTTLLHLAIDFDELEIFNWLLEQGADVNARAIIDDKGFGGHTPLYNAIISGRQRDGYMAKQLLAGGARKDIKANIRKFLDWREKPGWHTARNVTPLEWADGFPERSWVNPTVADLLRQDT